MLTTVIVVGASTGGRAGGLAMNAELAEMMGAGDALSRALMAR